MAGAPTCPRTSAFTVHVGCEAGMVESAWWHTTRNKWGAIRCEREGEEGGDLPPNREKKRAVDSEAQTEDKAAMREVHWTAWVGNHSTIISFV
jgi:hypothetical protein